MILTAILKIALATLKMEKFEMANEKIFMRKDCRTYSESLILVSGSAGLSQIPDVSISTMCHFLIIAYFYRYAYAWLLQLSLLKESFQYLPNVHVAQSLLTGAIQCIVECFHSNYSAIFKSWIRDSNELADCHS